MGPVNNTGPNKQQVWLASSPSAVFDVTEYGAVGDGVTYRHSGRAKAAQALRDSGSGGTLLLPSRSGGAKVTQCLHNTEPR